jgi:hypothetical protein
MRERRYLLISQKGIDNLVFGNALTERPLFAGNI